MTKIICISGKAQHGKDTTAKFLKEALDNEGYSTLIVHYADYLKYICKTFLDWDGKKDEKGRRLLQMVGTDVIRERDPDFWVKSLKSVLKFFPNNWDYVIIPDCRFPNEIENMIVETDYGHIVPIHIRVVRPGYDSGLSEEAKNHISETALDNYPYHYLVLNDKKLPDLKEAVEYVCEHMIATNDITHYFFKGAIL